MNNNTALFLIIAIICASIYGCHREDVRQETELIKTGYIKTIDKGMVAWRKS